LKAIDDQLCEAGVGDVFYLQARIAGRNYYFVNDKLDMQRVIPLMRGKDPVVYMLEEIVTIIEAHGTDVADTIKSVFPSAEVSSIQFKHNQEQLDDEIPF
jgi:cyanate lyase